MVESVLSQMSKIKTTMREGKGTDMTASLELDIIEFKEMITLAKNIAYYKLIVQFIDTIKGKDSLNTVALKEFLEPVKASENQLAKVYLFNFFSSIL